MSFNNANVSAMNKSEIYNYGCSLLDNNDIGNAIKYITIAAEQGCVEAMMHLAQMYGEGDCVEIDEDESIKWYKLAAENGDYEAIRYFVEEIDLDYAEEPLEWYKLAAEGGNRKAIYALGYMYYRGDEVEQDYKEAYYWFDKDGFRDLPYYICADMYFYVDKDYNNAFRLYNAALKQGVEDAAYKIGEMYFYGLGTEQDYSKAFEILKYYNDEFDETIKDFAPPTVLYLLGEMYRNGWGVEKNMAEAEKLLRASGRS